MRSLLRHLRDGWRQWARTPLVTIVALVSLGLAIGANTAIFSLLNALLLKPLPGHRPEQLVTLTDERGIPGNARMTTASWQELVRQQDIFQEVAGYSTTSFDLAGQGEPARRVDGLYVSGNYFPMLGIAATHGRLFNATDDSPATDPRIAVLSYAFWQSAYGGAHDVLGRTISINRQTFTIVGVTPGDFFGTEVGRTFNVAVTMNAYPVIDSSVGSDPRRTPLWFYAIARLREGQNVAQAQSALHALQPRVRDASASSPREVGTPVRRLWMLKPTMEIEFGARTTYRAALPVLAGVVGLVLLIACVNLANLLLARGAARRHEMGVRRSLGASRSTLIAQFFVEGLMLAAAGTVLGIVTGPIASRAFVAMLSTETRPMFLDVSLDMRVLAFVSAAGILSALIFGMAPAFQSSRVDPIEPLRSRAGHGRGMARLGASHILIASQVALTFVLVFGAVALVRTFRELVTQSFGFERDRVTVVNVDTIRLGLPQPQQRALADQVRVALSGVPGVEAAAHSLNVPFGSVGFVGIATVPTFTPSSEEDARFYYNYVSADYFRVMGISILAGADFDRFDGSRGALVSEAFAQKFFSDPRPLGRSFNMGKDTWQVIGVTPDVKFGSLRSQPVPFAYLPSQLQTRVQAYMNFSVRSAVPAATLRRAIVESVHALVPGASVRTIELDREAQATVLRERAVATISASFAGLAVLLAAIGLYGVMAYHVSRRTTEIGIRAALGASPRRVQGLVLSQVGILTLGGLVIGIGLSIWAGRLLVPLLYQLSPSDPVILGTAALILVATSAVAGYLPARRAGRVDPMLALRQE